VKIAKDFMKKKSKDLYDFAIIQIPDGWPIPECPNSKSWNNIASEVFLESIASICEGLLKSLGAILVLMKDDRGLKRKIRSFIEGSPILKEFKKRHIWNLVYLQKPDGRKVCFLFL
jgi:hypothetical protein